MEHQYTPRGKTRKPCPACKGDKLRPIDGVCPDCRMKLDEWEELQQQQAARQDVGRYHIPRQESAMPHYSTDGDQHAPHQAKSRAIQAALWQLMREGAEIMTRSWRLAHPETEYNAPDSSWHSTVIFPWPRGRYDETRDALMTPAFAQALAELDRAILETVRQAYLDGVADGSNLLRQLAAGEITAAQLNTITAGRNR